MYEITPVILAGGRGLRLRPITAHKRPKPFLRLFSGSKSPFQLTLQRCSGFAPALILCHQDHIQTVHNQCHEMGISPYHILAEPCSRNTAPAILAAAIFLENRGCRHMLVMPSDHIITPPSAIYDAVQTATAKNMPKITMLGIPARRYNGRYGYICAKNDDVTSFTEKPDKATFEKLQSRTNVLYVNTGIFLAETSHLTKHASTTLKPLIKNAKTDKNVAIIGKDYKKEMNISIDYAFFEQQSGQKTIKIAGLNAKWCDIGTKKALLSAIISDHMKSLFK